MEEKPHILILGSNSKRGKHTFNFDKYAIRLNYQFNTEGIIIEMFPPNKKKQIDYNQYVSPYLLGTLDLKQVKSQISEKKSKKKENKENIKKVKKRTEGNKERTEKVSKTKTYKKAVIKKCAIQEVFNFSEVPEAINKYFPYEGFNQASQQSITKNPQYPGPRCLKSKTTLNKDSSILLGMRITKSNDVGFFLNNHQNHSNMHLRTNHSNISIRNKNSVTVLQKVLDKLQRENRSLQKKLACVNRPFL